ncbi:Sphingosine N-acyltransferase lag1 [Basidiobolus ranarum]|uniref:Sphingosine N-acyltransferase lag1 n=1 Tax=Basidiobolus ranarum TaxID=34480 RepID=A0ABR2X155_9FUNG
MNVKLGRTTVRKGNYGDTYKEWFNFVAEHQMEVTFLLISTLLLGDLLHLPWASKFVRPSYRDDQGFYHKGKSDLCFVFFWTVGFTFLRAGMSWILKPISKHFGLESPSRTARFLEQGWLLIYYTTSLAVGLYISYHSKYWFDTRHFWIGYPHLHMSKLTKCYYLAQTSFWLHQIFVLHTEKKRKDYHQMVTHHVVTSMMLLVSYYTHFTSIGIMVLCMMDSADCVLSLGKCLRYIRYQKACDTVFGLFAITWGYTRHVLYFQFMWSIWHEADQYLSVDCRPLEGKFLCREIQYAFLLAFALLQILMMYWFSHILRIIYLVLRGTGAADTRSDSEG